MFNIILTTFSLLGLDVCDENSAGLMEYRSFCYPHFKGHDWLELIMLA